MYYVTYFDLEAANRGEWRQFWVVPLTDENSWTGDLPVLEFPENQALGSGLQNPPEHRLGMLRAGGWGKSDNSVGQIHAV